MATGSADLTAALKDIKARVASHAADRRTLADSLRSIVAEARGMLSELGEAAERVVTGRRRGRPAGRKAMVPPVPAAVSAPRNKRKMSAAARKAISMAQKKRWAAQKATAKK